jgi:hypothetical protein
LGRQVYFPADANCPPWIRYPEQAAQGAACPYHLCWAGLPRHGTRPLLPNISQDTLRPLLGRRTASHCTHPLDRSRRPQPSTLASDDPRPPNIIAYLRTAIRELPPQPRRPHIIRHPRYNAMARRRPILREALPYPRRNSKQGSRGGCLAARCLLAK